MVKEPQDYKKKEEVTEEEAVDEIALPGNGDIVEVDGEEFEVRKSISSVRGMRIFSKVGKLASSVKDAESDLRVGVQLVMLNYELLEHCFGNQEFERILDFIEKKELDDKEEYEVLVKFVNALTGMKSEEAEEVQDADSPK